PLDDIEVPDSVVEPIMARARFHGLIEEAITFEQIAEDPNYSSHSYNAREMLTAMRSEAPPDMKLAVDHVLAYLFAKSVEVTINRHRDNPQSEVRLTASYSTSDAIDGHLASTLDPEKHAALVNTMELAEQFGNDLYGFMKMAGKTDEDFEEIFTQAAVIVQRIGELYAQHGFTQKDTE
ncbi:MAG: hypothetical protein IJ744_06435, partial [Lachnospiraceae bacterium]|nr:hypothetical protein [Lachnospiraceae bacterium]